jgi:dienelactone hydrolase
MAKRLRDAGFAVLLLDLLNAEGVVNACRGEIAAPTIAQYISAAIDLAKSQPYVDPSEIFVLGWSMGGGGVIAWLSDPDIDSTVARSAITIYPGCGGKPSIQAQLPLLMLLGSADDIAEPGECEKLVGRSPSRSLITVEVYEGARHGFDIQDAPEVLDIGGGMTVGYQQEAAREAWQETLEFLRIHRSDEVRKAH